MIELSHQEVEVVYGGGVAVSEGAGAVVGYLSSQGPSDPYANLTAKRLQDYRASTTDATWYADFFKL